MAETTANKTAHAEHEAKNRRRLVGFFLFPIALFPLLALISYRWQAMEELNIPPETSSNLIGVVGDSFAYAGYQLIGLAIWAVLSNSQDPVITRNIYVPITYQNEDVLLAEEKQPLLHL